MTPAEMQVTGAVRIVVSPVLDDWGEPDWYQTERATIRKLSDLKHWPPGITCILDVADQRYVSYAIVDWIRENGGHCDWIVDADHPATVRVWLDAIRYGRCHLSLVEAS
jgi:hypothetical protein